MTVRITMISENYDTVDDCITMISENNVTVDDCTYYNDFRKL